jgi:hypothetical protein
MKFDYAVHSDFLVHWTGKDIDENDKSWQESDKSKTSCECIQKYLKRLSDILRFGFWMTKEDTLSPNNIIVPSTPRTCFTELKLSESRKHARGYGRLGIGVKRPFVFDRSGRPVIYYGTPGSNDIFLQQCRENLNDKRLLDFFKPMNSTSTLDYDWYSESEWRILYTERLLENKSIVDPRDPENVEEHKYFQGLSLNEQNKLEYLIPLTGWLGMIIYPSLDVKNEAQQGKTYKKESDEIKSAIEKIRSGTEDGSKPIEMDLDACRNF